MIALATLLAGGETCADLALFGRAKESLLRQFLPLPHGIPSHDTFRRVFRLLDPVQFRASFLRFMRHFAERAQLGGVAGGVVIAIDGKTLRRSYDRAAGASPLHLVSAWAVEQRLVLGQLAVDGKSNEITAVPALLTLLALRGVTVTADAMHGQRATAEQVTAQGGHDVLALKGNQPALHEEVQRCLEDARTPLARARTVDAGHGRVEEREMAVSTDVAWLQARHHWPGLAAVGKLTGRRTATGAAGGLPIPSVETRYFLLSQPLPPERFGAVVRSHWGIENQLHWVLDVVLHEDDARTRKDHGPENLAVLRRLALNLAKLEPSKGSMRGKRKRAGWDDTFLIQLLTQFASPQMR